MFAVIYKSRLKPDSERAFLKAWNLVAEYFVKERGAMSSTLHKSSQGEWVAYSKWPSKEMRDASWPGDGEEISTEIPLLIRQAIATLKACIDRDQFYEEICLEVVEEIKKEPK